MNRRGFLKMLGIGGAAVAAAPVVAKAVEPVAKVESGWIPYKAHPDAAPPEMVDCTFAPGTWEDDLEMGGPGLLTVTHPPKYKAQKFALQIVRDEDGESRWTWEDEA